MPEARNDATTGSPQNATRDANQIIDHALDCAARGYWTFPLAPGGKAPILPKMEDGEPLTFGFKPPVAPWSEQYLHEVVPGRWTVVKGAFHWAVREEAALRALFAYAEGRAGGRPLAVGIVSPGVVVDIDGPAPIPDAVKVLLDAAPGIETPKGRHRFFKLPEWAFGEDGACALKNAGLYDAAGEHFGDLRHLGGKGFTKTHGQAPPPFDTLPEMPQVVFDWLIGRQAQRPKPHAQPAPEPGERKAASLRDVMTGAAAEANEYDPIFLTTLKKGRHDYLLEGIRQDRRRGVVRCEAWAVALHQARGGDINAARKEVNSAWADWQAKTAADREAAEQDAAAEAAQQAQIDADADPPAGEGAVPGAAAGQGNREPAAEQEASQQETGPICPDTEPAQEASQQDGPAAARVPCTDERDDDGYVKQGKPDVELSGRGFLAVMEMADWEMRFNTATEAAECRRVGDEEWLEFKGLPRAEMVEEMSRAAVNGNQRNPWRIRNARHEADAVLWVAGQRIEDGEGGFVYEAAREWLTALGSGSRKFTPGEIAEAIDAYNVHEGGARLPDSIAIVIRRAAKRCGWEPGYRGSGKNSRRVLCQPSGKGRGASLKASRQGGAGEGTTAQGKQRKAARSAGKKRRAKNAPVGEGCAADAAIG